MYIGFAFSSLLSYNSKHHGDTLFAVFSFLFIFLIADSGIYKAGSGAACTKNIPNLHILGPQFCMYEKHTWPTYTIAPILHVRKTLFSYGKFKPKWNQGSQGYSHVSPREVGPPIPPCRPRGETTHLVRKKRSAYGKFRLKYRQGTKTSRPERTAHLCMPA